MFNVNKMLFAVVSALTLSAVAEGQAGLDYTGMGVQDAKNIFEGLQHTDQLKREKALELAAKLNGDQIEAWLNGLKKGCLEMGFSEGSAKNARTEFNAIFKAYPLTVNLVETATDAEGKETQTVKAIVAKDALATATGWNQMRDLARALLRAGKAQGQSEGAANSGGTKGTKAMQDSSFDRIYEDVAKRGTGAQAVQLLDLAIISLSKYYSQVIGNEIVQLREIESKIHDKIREFHDKQRSELKKQPAGKVVELLRSVPASAVIKEAPAPADAEHQVVNA